MNTCIRNPRPALSKTPGHAFQAKLSTSASLGCVLEVMNAKLPSFQKSYCLQRMGILLLLVEGGGMLDGNLCALSQHEGKIQHEGFFI